MDPVLGLSIVVLLADLVFASALVIGRGGSSKSYRVAFRAGLLGLITLPIWFLGLIAVVRQFFFVDPWSFAALCFISATVVVVIALFCVVYSWVKLQIAPEQ